jgi:hypothetical protein
MNSRRPSVMAVISVKASLFITQAHFQCTAVYCVINCLLGISPASVYCVFTVLQVIR